MAAPPSNRVAVPAMPLPAGAPAPTAAPVVSAGAPLDLADVGASRAQLRDAKRRRSQDMDSPELRHHALSDAAATCPDAAAPAWAVALQDRVAALERSVAVLQAMMHNAEARLANRSASKRGGQWRALQSLAAKHVGQSSAAFPADEERAIGLTDPELTALSDFYGSPFEGSDVSARCSALIRWAKYP
eukprot:m51a1_g7038 hypothetical protein (188) ;mRNA; f:102691-103439